MLLYDGDFKRIQERGFSREKLYYQGLNTCFKSSGAFYQYRYFIIEYFYPNSLWREKKDFLAFLFSALLISFPSLTLLAGELFFALQSCHQYRAAEHHKRYR